MNTPDVGDHVETKARRKIQRWHLRLTRDGAIFVTGIIGIVHEIFWSSADRPYLILLFGAMIGLPAFLHIDERGRGEGDK